jgi:hypothetical protein
LRGAWITGVVEVEVGIRAGETVDTIGEDPLRKVMRRKLVRKGNALRSRMVGLMLE